MGQVGMPTGGGLDGGMPPMQVPGNGAKVG
jgi:hypothetical protein